MTALAWGLAASASLASLLVLLLLASGLLWVRYRLPRLPRVPAELPPGGRWPRLSVVVPARDEAPHVETAVRSLLGQDYPALEVVAVDDRSLDGTGAILDRLAAEDPRLVVVHVRELPPGWLGKNHACHEGAARASGEWLLFTDGDVHFAPDALRRAVAFAETRRLGHLVAFPQLVAHGFLERAFVTAFGLLFNLKCRVWDLRRPGSSAYVGVGAFNLVAREALRRVGGHRALAFEVVDDLKLGLILRRSGVRQGAVDAEALVWVRWQAGFRASLAGLLKNAFAGTEWSWRQALSLATALGLLTLAPAAALLLPAPAPPGVPALAAAALGGWMLLHGAVAHGKAGGSGLEGLLFPLAVVALIGVLLASALRASLTGGITWRGTRYPLVDLRAGCVRERDWPTRAAVGWD